MATSSTILTSLFIPGRTTTPINSRNHQVLFLQNQNHYLNRSVPHKKRVSFSVQAQAAKPPAGVCTSYFCFLCHLNYLCVTFYFFTVLINIVHYEAVGYLCFFRWNFQKCSHSLRLHFLGSQKQQKCGILELP